MSSNDLRSPTRLPQPMAPINTGDSHQINLNKTQESRRRSMLPQRSTSGGSVNSASPLDLEGPGANTITNTGTAMEMSSTTSARPRLGSVAERGRGDDSEGDEAAVSVQRRAALDTLEGDRSSQPASRLGHTRDTSLQNRQSCMIPQPGLSRGTMPPPSGLARASSTRVPSTTTSSTARPERASRMAPPSAAASAVSRNQSRHTASSSTGSARPSSRSSTTATGAGRPASSSSMRPPSASSTTGRIGRSDSTSSSGAGLNRNSSLRNPSKPATKPGSTAVPSLQAKPQFTTYQQHYSPKKDLAPKPLTSSFLPKASSATQPSLSRNPLEPPNAETIRQQTQLLQLSIMHSQALSSLSSYQSSAKQKLRSRFKRLAQRSAAVQVYERDDRTARNVEALEDWGGGSGAGLQENVRVLSGVLREVAALQSALDKDGDAEAAHKFDAQPGSGRFDRLVAQFADWMSEVEEAWEVRNAPQDSPLDAIDAGIPEPLPRTWHLELAALQRKATLLLRELDCLDTPVPGSSVAGILHGATELIRGMAEEMRAMKAVSGAIMEREMAWVDAEVGRIELDGANSQVAVGA